jgi:DNA-directed RNA polymerase specialized sigma24 family protein
VGFHVDPGGGKPKKLACFLDARLFSLRHAPELALMDENPAASEQSVDVELGHVPSERLFEVVRRGQNLDDWNSDFSAIVEQVAAAVRARFKNRSIAESAAQSAMATILRRARDGELDRVEGPQTLFGYALLSAIHKAWKKLKDRYPAWPEKFDPQVASRTTDREASSQIAVEVAAIRAEMAYQLNRALERMNLLLKNDQQRHVFELLYRKMYQVEKLTDAAISARCGVTERTVRRVRKRVEEHWPQLVAEGRRAVQDLKAQFRRARN